MKCNLIRFEKAADFNASLWPGLQSKQIDLMWRYYSTMKHSNRSALTQAMMKELLSQKFPKRDIEIIHLPGGKPEAIISCVGKRAVSATHSGKYVAICTAKVRFLGIDVQELVDWSNENKRFAAFTTRELHCIRTSETSTQYFEDLTTLWTAKEAICKSFGVGLSKGMHYVEIMTDLRTNCEIILNNNTQRPLEEPILFIGKIGDAACALFSAESSSDQNCLQSK